MKIVTVVGARPHFVKAAVVSRAIASYNTLHGELIREVLVHTGQHYNDNMSAIFFREMKIPQPHYNLGVCDCSHGAMTGRMLEHVEQVLINENPDIVMVYGDTNSTLAGALAAAKLLIPVAHVEAGLRSFNMQMPEEVNRILTDRVSTFLFCPTETAVKNIAAEGLTNKSRAPIVAKVGDVMYDAALYYKKIARPSDSISALLEEVDDGFYIATVHRAENTDSPKRLRGIFEALCEIVKGTPVVIPMHPRTRRALADSGIRVDGLKCIDPVGYFDMLILLAQCKAVFTDSGGLQKEAYFFRKPCITVRDETEWVELVEHGFNTLVSADKDSIIMAESKLSDVLSDYSVALYGNGAAGERIVEIIRLRAVGTDCDQSANWKR
jgi:UDP-GlcNAc3NAcA epimerase